MDIVEELRTGKHPGSGLQSSVSELDLRAANEIERLRAYNKRLLDENIELHNKAAIAHEEGARDMRQRAALHFVENPYRHDGLEIAEAIRALPLGGEK